MMSPYKKLNYESLTIYFKQHIIKKCFVIKILRLLPAMTNNFVQRKGIISLLCSDHIITQMKALLIRYNINQLH